MMQKLKKAFSVAEGFIMLLVVSVALGASAPIVTKQIKHNNFSSTQTKILNGKIDDAITQSSSDIKSLNDYILQLEERINTIEKDTKIPAGTIAFFNKEACPEGWKQVTASDGSSLAGYYPRIAGLQGEVVGTKKEQMVHRHKHVSSKIEHLSSTVRPYFRYGPYSTEDYANNTGDTDGNSTLYPVKSSSVPTITMAWYLNYLNGQFVYTSDGMNREEIIEGKRFLTCPNRDEDDEICKPTGNMHGIPYLAQMPVVGNENRPNSVVWLACEKK